MYIGGGFLLQPIYVEIYESMVDSRIRTHSICGRVFVCSVVISYFNYEEKELIEMEMDLCIYLTMS